MTKILVYDANARFLEILKAAVTSLGYEAVAAADGYSVLPLVQQHAPRLVVLEYNLPDSDGVSILKRIRALPAFASTPAIFVTGVPRLEMEMLLLDAPAVDCIGKPLDTNQLKAAVESLLGPRVAAAPAPSAPPPTAAPSPAAPQSPPPVFSGEPDLDGTRDDIIDLD
ncbi:MAG: hypothetical protein COV48_07920 [Elusimicrobia bacterium CG11_big_fil_rev_8_21_14_0_20_64_6]|nr:MAG: hypothetical protein COV48_07920 [Elusimicrobia bacterium CG11_big_fil_rev_8_21_14_0_20_64_6]